MKSPLAAVRRFLADEPYRRLPDDELWARFRDHADGDALRLVLEKVGGRLSARCRAVTGDPALAEDALQEALVQLVRHRRRIGSYGQAVAWLYRVTDSRARMLVRSRRRAWWRDRRAARPEAVADQPPADFEVVTAAVARLPVRERRAVELVYLEGMTHDEAAAALGLSRGSVGSYVSRGVQRLRDRLGPAGLAVALAADGLAPERATALAATALTRGLAARWLPVPLVATVVGLGLVAGGVGYVATRDGPPPEVVVAMPPATLEPVSVRNLRLFESDVRPELETALRALAGPVGSVRLLGTGAYDTRLECNYEVVSRATAGPGVRHRWLFCYNTADGRHNTAYAFGDGPMQSIDPRQAGPLFGMFPLRLPAVETAEGLFGRLPNDTRTQAEAAEFRARLSRAMTALIGEWRAAGDLSRRCIVEPFPDGVLHFVWDDGRDTWLFPNGPLFDSDGRLCSSLFGLWMIAAPDGRRIEFAGGEPWERPTAAPP